MSDRPHSSYLVLIGVFLGIFGVAADRVQRSRSLLATTPPARDLFLLGVATYRLSRLVTYDRVTSVLRAPIVKEGVGTHHLEGSTEKSEGTGLKLSLSQLFT